MKSQRTSSNETTARLNRRQLLRIGGLGAFGLSLARLFQAEAAARGSLPSSATPPLRHCILIFYYGGPSHLDTWDMKPSAPREIRGEFRPSATTAPGVHVCEHLPHCARIMHRTAIVRSLYIKKGRLPAPARHWRKNIGPGEVSLMAAPHISSNGQTTTRPSPAPTMSSPRFQSGMRIFLFHQ